MKQRRWVWGHTRWRSRCLEGAGSKRRAAQTDGEAFPSPLLPHPLRLTPAPRARLAAGSSPSTALKGVVDPGGGGARADRRLRRPPRAPPSPPPRRRPRDGAFSMVVCVCVCVVVWSVVFRFIEGGADEKGTIESGGGQARACENKPVRFYTPPTLTPPAPQPAPAPQSTRLHTTRCPRAAPRHPRATPGAPAPCSTRPQHRPGWQTGRG